METDLIIVIEIDKAYIRKFRIVRPGMITYLLVVIVVSTFPMSSAVEEVIYGGILA